MSYSVTLDPARQDLDAIHALLSSTYWSPGIRKEVVACSLANSLTSLAIDDTTGKIIGLARVVTDYATFAWLCDVIVHEDHRGRGLSKRLIAALEGDPRLSTLRRWCLATRDAHGLYTQFGYELVRPDRWMEKRLPDSNWKELPLHGNEGKQNGINTDETRTSTPI